MGTLDFVYDLKERLDDEKMEYVLLIVQHAADESHVNAFYSIEKDSSADMLCMASQRLCDNLGVESPQDNLTLLSIDEKEEISDKKNDDKDEDAGEEKEQE